MPSDLVCMGTQCLAILFVWVHMSSDFVSMGTQCLAILFVWAQSV